MGVPAGPPLRLAPPTRAPAVVVAISLVIGILLDRVTAFEMTTWLGVAAVALLGGVWSRSRGPARVGATWSLVGIAALAGARHHEAWSVRPANDVARWAGREPRLVVLTGRVAEPPYVRRKPEVSRTSWPEFDRTLFALDTEELEGDDGAIAVSGRVRVSITGHLPRLQAGDRLVFRGWFAKPRPPGNPGEFDFAQWLRGKGIGSTAWASHPDAVEILERGSPWNVVRIAARIRTVVERRIARQLDGRTAPIAEALLVGTRSGVPEETRAAFAESGTLHLLAISGLHVGILAAFVWCLCRVCGLRAMSMAVLLLGVLAWYAVLVGGRPSVLRASVFVAVAVLGRPWQRRASAYQVLAFAAVLLLAWRPCDLFDTGRSSRSWRSPRSRSPSNGSEGARGVRPRSRASSSAGRSGGWSNGS